MLTISLKALTLDDRYISQTEAMAMKDISLKMDEYLPLRDVVFNTLRDAIMTGELLPGERLMEIKLADKLRDSWLILPERGLRLQA